jgi:hypothetical protein
MARGREHIAPRSKHALVGNRAVIEGEHTPRIVEGVQAREPLRIPAAKRECELSPIPPRECTRPHDGKGDLSSANALHRVANDLRLRAELRDVPNVLELAAAASIHYVVHARRLNT